MKIWEKGYKTDINVDQFTVGNDRMLDMHLARYDIMGSQAHAHMLCHIGILTQEENLALQSVLSQLLADIEIGSFQIEDGFEDIHSKVEFELVARLGDLGKKIHTARSRNDQVLVDLHLYAKEELQVIHEKSEQLFHALLEQAQKHQGVLLPGYTHFQVAMPSSFGLWFGAYAETLIDDGILLQAALCIADQNPLGSAAGYGSSFPVDRELTTRLLHFNTLKYNSVAAQMSRGRLERTVTTAIASFAATLSKYASDICLYMSQNFDFIRFPKELTTGSSIMPHKKNPDVAELIRARANKLQSVPAQVMLICNNLPSGYHRDFQELKALMINSIVEIKSLLDMAIFITEKIQVALHPDEDPRYRYMYSVEAVNKLVMEGQSFRDAYRQVGTDIESGEFVPLATICHTHIGSIGNPAFKEIRDKWHRMNAKKENNIF